MVLNNTARSVSPKLSNPLPHHIASVASLGCPVFPSSFQKGAYHLKWGEAVRDSWVRTKWELSGGFPTRSFQQKLKSSGKLEPQQKMSLRLNRRQPHGAFSWLLVDGEGPADCGQCNFWVGGLYCIKKNKLSKPWRAIQQTELLQVPASASLNCGLQSV